MARLLLILGRLIGFAAATLTITLSVWWGYEVIRYLFFSENPTWGEVGIIPFVLVLRLVVAAWVVWSVLKEDAVYLLLALLILGVGSFGGLLGWYFMLLGSVREFFSYDNLPYLLAACDLLYIAAGLVMGCALLWPVASSRTSNDSP